MERARAFRLFSIESSFSKEVFVRRVSEEELIIESFRIMSSIFWRSVENARFSKSTNFCVFSLSVMSFRSLSQRIIIS